MSCLPHVASFSGLSHRFSLTFMYNYIVNSLIDFCLTPLFLAIFKSRTILQTMQFPTSYVVDLCVFSELRRDVVVRFVNIDGIVFLQLF